jgi:glycosidase
MNLVASHDSPRLSTSFLNKQKYKFQMGARGNKQLKLGPPDKTTTSQIRMMLLHQFTYLSAPHIWNGDELGMWGADDPDCRKPLLWGNIDHNPQIFAPDGSQDKAIAVTPNQERFSYQKKLISLRRGRLEWTRGSTHFLHSNDENLTLAYLRKTDHHRSLIAFNLSNKPRILSLDNLAASDFEVLVESSSEALLSGTIEGRSLRLKPCTTLRSSPRSELGLKPL